MFFEQICLKRHKELKINCEPFVKDIIKPGHLPTCCQKHNQLHTYIDHINKTVFNGSNIGKEYGAKAIMEKFEGFQEKQTIQQAQKIEISIAKPEEKGVADEMKKAVDSSLLAIIKSG